MALVHLLSAVRRRQGRPAHPTRTLDMAKTARGSKRARERESEAAQHVEVAWCRDCTAPADWPGRLVAAAPKSNHSNYWTCVHAQSCLLYYVQYSYLPPVPLRAILLCERLRTSGSSSTVYTTVQ